MVFCKTPQFKALVVVFGELLRKPLWELDKKNEGIKIGGGGTNLSDKGLNLRGSWQQGHSAPYNTPSRI